MEDIDPIFWWNNLSIFWKDIFKNEVLINLKLSINDDDDIEKIDNTIRKLWKLTSIDLSFDIEKNNRSRISSLKPLLPFQNLIQINLNGNNVQPNGLRFIAHLQKLKKLELMENGIDNINQLANFPHLEILELGSNKILDINPLRQLNNLKILGLSNNQIEDIDVLRYLKNLEELFLFSNRITKIDSLSHLLNLRYLALGKNNIIDLNPLSDLHSLKKLALGANLFIRDISPLQNLINLEKLGLNDNIRISNISVLKKLTSLRNIYLYKVPCTKTELDELQKYLPLCHIEISNKRNF